MAYIFDPIRNTFIDDEDKSLGNKLALNDEEIDKVVDAAAVVAGGVNPNSLSKFAKAATEAATTADGKKIGNSLHPSRLKI